MAKVTVCDWCRAEVHGEAEVKIQRGADSLSMDLCDKDWKKLQSGPQAQSTPAAATGAGKRDGIKKWGAENGFPMVKGRASRELVAAWDKAHS